MILPTQAIQDQKINVFAYLFFATAGNSRSKKEFICQPIISPPHAIQDPTKYLPTNYLPPQAMKDQKTNVFAFQIFATLGNTRSKINVFAYLLFCPHRQYRIQNNHCRLTHWIES